MLAGLLALLLGCAHVDGVRATPTALGPPPPPTAGQPKPANHAGYLAWADRLKPTEHPESYAFRDELHARIATLARERPGVVQPFMAGLSVQGQPIWAFRLRDPVRPIHTKVLVFGGTHALEWISSEVALHFLEGFARRPPPGVEVIVLPILNPDGRRRVEADLLDGENVYRRSNANGVDLNRDFGHHRSSGAIWKALLPAWYTTSAAPLSQPESQALDALAHAEGFDVSVSLHAFGGYIYHPYGGVFARPDNWAEYKALGQVMAAGQGKRAYEVRQLCHWNFLFRILGTELDHMHMEHGAMSFLIELSRSGIEPLDRGTWKNHFRWYNPTSPDHHVGQGVGALQALVGHLSGGTGR
jgi:hypothetical protein